MTYFVTSSVAVEAAIWVKSMMM